MRGIYKISENCIINFNNEKIIHRDTVEELGHKASLLLGKLIEYKLKDADLPYEIIEDLLVNYDSLIDPVQCRRDTVKEIRKKEGKKAKESVIGNKRGLAYYLKEVPVLINNYDEFPLSDIKIVTDMSKYDFQERQDIQFYLTPVKYISGNNILFREDIILNILNKLFPSQIGNVTPKINIVISDIGGSGKTTVAKAVYGNIINDEKSVKAYSSIGWIDYNINLKNSILNANEFRIAEKEKDSEKRWKIIGDILLKGQYGSKVLLFIDNIDQKAEIGQFPNDDKDLQLFADSPFINLVMTSRLSFPVSEESVVPVLLPQFTLSQCVDLFYYFWGETTRNQSDIAKIEKIVEYVGYHILPIKTIASNARFIPLDEYIVRINDFKSKLIFYDKNDEKSVIRQLSTLFDLKTRTTMQSNIVLNLAILPQISLTSREMKFLFNYSPNDIQPLVNEGWINYDGRFYIHPLIKEAIRIQNLPNKETLSFLISRIENNTLISVDDSFPAINKKILIVDTVLKIININDLSPDFLYNYGMLQYDYVGKRLTAIQFLEKAILSFEQLNIATERLASAVYNCGYIKSTTQTFREESKDDLRKALKLWEQIQGYQYEADMARDHLGYVLSDEKSTYDEAEYLLRTTCEARKNRCDKDNSAINQLDYATTCDNLACLLMKSNSDSDEVISLLRVALQIREDMMKSNGGYESEVSWTLYNIGKYYYNIKQYSFALNYLNNSLNLRKSQNYKYSGRYSADVAYTLVAIVKTMLDGEINVDLAETFLQEAIDLRKAIDSEHTGFFSKEMEEDILNLAQRFNHLGISTT